MKSFLFYICICFAILLSGCAATQGPKPIVSANGSTSPDVTTGLAGKFNSLATASFGNPNDTSMAKSMMDSGFALAYASCSDYFLSAGETQKWIIVSRDVVGAVGSLSTAVLALHSGGKNAAANMALATGIGFTGLDVYTKNFLFAAENISAVRTLITQAMAVHQQTVQSLGTVTYQTAMVALFDNQEICSPMKIAALAREAIQKGTVVAAPDPATDLARIAREQDQKVLEALGKILNPPGALSMDEAGALWWLLKDSSTTDEKKKLIAPKLKGLPANTNPFDSNGDFIADWNNDQAAKMLNNLSETTKASFKAAIDAAKGAYQDAVTRKIATPPTPKFEGGHSFPIATSTHISVGIR